MENNTDEALLNAARTGDTEALDMLMHRYKPLVKIRAKYYFLAGGDLEDLIQEGMIGLYKAVLDFEPGKGAKFSSFASICVVRQIQTAIKAASRKKHSPLNTSVSLHNQDNPEGDHIPASGINNPETLFLGIEAYKDIGAFIQDNLSPFEHNVLALHLDGHPQPHIGEKLQTTPKAVENALGRIRRKIAKSFKT